MKNKELADLFGKMADILEFKGENPFKIGAYRKASRVIGDLTQDVQELAESGKLRQIQKNNTGIVRDIILCICSWPLACGVTRICQ